MHKKGAFLTQIKRDAGLGKRGASFFKRVFIRVTNSNQLECF